MTPEPRWPLKLDDAVQQAVDELRGLILQRYPDATFDIQRGPDDPEAVLLITIVDLDDPDEVMDLVIDRMMELQIEHGAPVFVVPLRSPERLRALLQEDHYRRPTGALLT
jgi:hypothetical protein